jgi:Fe-S cluster biogenesis protein NfuA
MSDNTADIPAKDRIKALIDTLDAYISHYHGGSVEMIDFDGHTLKVRLGGACENCPLSMTTLNGWVAGTVRQFFPEIENVVDINETQK